MKLYRLTGLFLFAAFSAACSGEATDSDDTFAEDRGTSESADDSSEATEPGSDLASDSQLDEDSTEKGQSGDDNDQNQSDDNSEALDEEGDNKAQGDDNVDEADGTGIANDDSDSVVCQAIGCEKEELCGGENKPEADCKPGYECINQAWSCIDDGKVCPKPGSQKEAFEGPAEACAQVITYVTHPKTGLCCEYSDTCSGPGNWDASYTSCE